MVRSDILIDKLVADLHFHHYLEVTGDDLLDENRNVVVTDSKKEVIENYVDDVFIDFFFRTHDFAPVVISGRLLDNCKADGHNYHSDIILQLKNHRDRCAFVKYISNLFSANSLLAKEFENNFFVRSFLHVSRSYGPFWKVVVLKPDTPLGYEYEVFLTHLYGYRHSRHKTQFRGKAIVAFNKFYQENWTHFGYNGLTTDGLLLMERRYADYQKIKSYHMFGGYTLEEVLLLYALLVDKFILSDDNITGFLAKFITDNNMVINKFDEFEMANQDFRIIEPYLCQYDLYLRFISPARSKAITYRMFGGLNKCIEIQFFNHDIVLSECNGNTLPLPYYYYHRVKTI